MFIGQQKGFNTKTRQYRNFGMANPEGYRKALRLMKSAEKFNIPVVCFIDTPGAYPGIEAEERGQGEAIARNILEMTRLKVPIIVVIDMKKQKLIDEIIREPLGGAHANRDKTFTTVKNKITAHFEELKKLSPKDLVKSRMDKYAEMGVFNA